jgi:predicted dehydrogenase
MSKIPLAIVGCGGMGHRHLYGLNELHKAGLNRFELIGACDPVTDNAESLANQAAEYFGRRPTVVSKIDELAPLGVSAVDITTTPRFHHSLAVQALHHNMHMMIEKPVGLTVRACNIIKNAAQKLKLVVSVAENYRRDPINRLAKALIDNGIIGAPRLMIHNTVGGTNRMLISVWRHQKDQSGVLLDVGVHFSDMMEYFLGPITHIYGQTRLHEPIRHNPVAEGATASAPNPIYERFQRQMPAQFTATAEDACYATLTFANGAVGQYIEDHAGWGQGVWSRQIHGSKGSLDLPHDRSGQVITLHRAGQEPISDGRLLDLTPDFRLDQATAILFGGDRLWKYEFPFQETDRKLLAVEYADLAAAILGEHPAEVDIVLGARSVGVSYGILESGLAGRVVTMDEILNEELDDYQKEINDSLDI